MSNVGDSARLRASARRKGSYPRELIVDLRITAVANASESEIVSAIDGMLEREFSRRWAVTTQGGKHVTIISRVVTGISIKER